MSWRWSRWPWTKRWVSTADVARVLHDTERLNIAYSQLPAEVIVYLANRAETLGAYLEGIRAWQRGDRDQPPPQPWDGALDGIFDHSDVRL